MGPGDQRELTRGLTLAAIAMASAVATATVVIGVGGAWLDRTGHGARAGTLQPETVRPVQLIRTSG